MNETVASVLAYIIIVVGTCFVPCAIVYVIAKFYVAIVGERKK